MIVTLILALCIDALSVLSRSAILAFSLADMEEVLRKRDRIQALMPRYEAFADDAKDLADNFLFVTQITKAIAACSLYVLVHTWWPDSMEFGSINLLAISISIFVVLILSIDALMRPIGAAYPERICSFFLSSWRVAHVVLYVPLMPVRLLNQAVTV